MDQSRRAVESYWRSRMVDGVTADDDKVAPVYKLEEICELLRASDASIVKEVADFVLKRLDNKSPLVKQKVGALASASASAPPGIGFACLGCLALLRDICCWWGRSSDCYSLRHRRRRPCRAAPRNLI
jgi:hypothetical protein